MKQFLAIAALSVFALVIMDSGRLAVGPTGLAKGGQAMAAELPVKAPPPPPAPVGKGKAPILGKGKYPVVTAR